MNRSNITKEWNPDDGVEVIFTRITDARQFAAAAGAANAITEATATYLGVTAIENTGMFDDACSEWQKLDAANQTLARFRTDFTHAAKERNRHATAKSAGYQALTTTGMDTKENKSPQESKPHVVVDSINMFYCWTHGLGFSSNHTSCTCKKKADGHCDDATIKDRKGGSN